MLITWFILLVVVNNMTIKQLEELGIFTTVKKKQGNYSVNNAPYQSVQSIVAFLFKQRNIVVDVEELRSYLNQLAKEDKVAEKDIQAKIHKWWGGEREVKVATGIVDLVTDTQIVEVKEASSWKHSFGQILSYAPFFQTKEKVLYLFGTCPNNLHECYKLCKQNNIRLICEFW